jgi:hypothetical protein
VVRQANRFTLDPGREGALAEVVRVVQQEANPLQEQLLLLLERDIGATFEVAYHERIVGLEEDLESVELIAAIRIERTSTVALLLQRESDDGTSFVLLERSPAGRWRLQWRSAPARC